MFFLFGSFHQNFILLFPLKDFLCGKNKIFENKFNSSIANINKEKLSIGAKKWTKDTDKPGLLVNSLLVTYKCIKQDKLATNNFCFRYVALKILL